MQSLIFGTALASQWSASLAFVPPSAANVNNAVFGAAGRSTAVYAEAATNSDIKDVLNRDDVSSSGSLTSNRNNNKRGGKFLIPQSHMLSLINKEKCFSTVDGAKNIAASCAVDVLYKDYYEPQTLAGTKYSTRRRFPSLCISPAI